MIAKDKSLLHLAEYINKSYPLPDFMETEIGCKLMWSKNMQSALCNCCMPDHNDHNASCRVNLIDDVWVYHCFGCGRSGTLVSFCKEYYGLPNRIEAIMWLCKKFNVKNTEELIVKSMTTLSKKIDMQRKMENENILVSNLCRMLLRKDFNANRKWVSQAYREINRLMEEEKFDELQKMGEKASNILSGKVVS